MHTGLQGYPSGPPFRTAVPATRTPEVTMTDRPPESSPENTPSLDAGGGSPPGDTPPAAGQTSGLSADQPSARHRAGWTGGIGVPVAVSVTVVFLIIAVLLILWAAGVW